MKPAIRVKNLSKLYRLGARQTSDYQTFREAIVQAAEVRWRRLRDWLATTAGEQRGPAAPETVWALKDVSFEVRPGEVVGIIGRNGAGKSTLLKILSLVTEPSSGRAEFRGRVGSLLEVGTGFHYELTGRENIFLYGAVLGMSRREITRRFDEIVAFAGTEAFLDTPVKRYSSGMHMRLAFAVASHLETEILLVDEALAVGDQAFQNKCLGRMGELSRTGRTVLFVSHRLAAIENLCETVVVLERGRLVYAGDCKRGMELYTSGNRVWGGEEVDLSDHVNRRPGARPIFRKIRLLNRSGTSTGEVFCGEPLVLELSIDPDAGPKNLHFSIGFEDACGSRLFTVSTLLSSAVFPPVNDARRLRCLLDQLPLAPGRYGLSLHTGTSHQGDLDVIDPALWFNVVEADFYGNGRLPAPSQGRFLVRSRWPAPDAGPTRNAAGPPVTGGER